MMFRQDFKKIYVVAVFFLANFVTIVAYGLLFNGVAFKPRDGIFLVLLVALAVLWCLSYYWYYIKIEGGKFMTVVFGSPTKSIPAEDIIEFSYEDNPARPLARITFNQDGGVVGQTDFTTGAWNPHTLKLLADEIHRLNPKIVAKVDERTEKKFEKERDYHLHHPRNVWGWLVLGVKQSALGVLFGAFLVAISKLL